MTGIDLLARILVIIGGLNWGLWGLFSVDLVAAIFGGPYSVLARIVYILVGVSAAWLAFRLASDDGRTVTRTTTTP
jgi:hypothetical protein